MKRRTFIIQSAAALADMPFASATVVAGSGRRAVPDGLQHRPARGPLRVHPTNPRYFADAGGKVVYLTGFQYRDSLRDDGTLDPRALNFTQFLDIVERDNANFVRLWRWNELARFRYTRDGEAFYTSPAPWARTGPGTALDGRPKFDLNQFNPAYFDQLRARVTAARDRGIYVAVMLFEGHALQFSDSPWRWHG
ncbi:MAG: hypothetical protein NZT92_13250, partial [Abditibacteriales bacterium]|nr:hypothetical protein [Abditibacteriales bacterium]